jgi:succinoglycan biosynthesis protein ExoA
MPLVSIIVPCYNEQATIRLLLEAICRQTVANRELEVIIADGQSTDQTRDVVSNFQYEYPDLAVRLVDNPRRIIPAALNCAIDVAQGQYIIRLDAHSVPAVDYIERCVENLEACRGENVGGVWEIRSQGAGLLPRSIAIAAAHPFGVGDALYRYTSQAGYVDTVPFGAFRREVFEQYGRFDESLLTNEDYEFNTRLKLAGGRVWLDPRIRSTYFARSNIKALSRQYWRYGYWKWRMLRRYPRTLRWRQGLPPLFVVSLIALLVLSPWWGLARLALAAELILYAAVLMAGSMKPARVNQDFRFVFTVPLSIATMHVSWGAGFLWSMLTGFLKKNHTAALYIAAASFFVRMVIHQNEFF